MDDSQPRNWRYVAILAAVSSVILIGGWWARPREVPQTPAPVPTETELEQLARRAERRSLDDMKQFFAGVAREAGPSIVAVPATGTSGVAWDASHIVTTARHRAWSAGHVSIIAASETQAEPETWGPNLPLSVLTIRSGATSVVPARRSDVMPATGDWIVGVWRTGAAPAYGIGNFRQLSRTTCDDIPVQELATSLSLTSASLAVGATMVNLAGRSRQLFGALSNTDPPFYAIFFVLAGAELDVSRIPAMGALGVVYIAGRAAGKFGGARFAAGRLGLAPSMRRFLGFALQAQAGLAVGLTLAVNGRYPQLAPVVTTVVLASVAVFEMIGPASTRFALVRAGEAGALKTGAANPLSAHL